MKRIQNTTAIFSFFLLLLCILLLLTFNDTDLMKDQVAYAFIVIITFIAIILTCLSFYSLISIHKHKVSRQKQKEKNIREYYQYHELLNPPGMDN